MTLHDITPKLESAQRAGEWSREGFLDLLDSLSGALKSGSVDWDHAAGEEWGRVLLGGEVVALLWHRGTFGFVTRKNAGALAEALREHSVQFEIVEDWDDVQYKIDPGFLLRASGRGQISSAFNPAGFSANDLWWATV